MEELDEATYLMFAAKGHTVDLGYKISSKAVLP